MCDFYYTEKESKEFLKSLIYLVDTREKANKHIIEYFEANKIAYKTRALPAGDYSVMVPKNWDLGVLKDTYLNLDKAGGILIERKNSLEELASNLGKKRAEFENELEKMKQAEKHLIIEDGNWNKIRKGIYNSELSSSSYFNSLLTFQTRYGLHIHFTDKQSIAPLIRGIVENKIKEKYNL